MTTASDIWVLVRIESLEPGNVVFVPSGSPGDAVDLGFAGRIVGSHTRDVNVKPRSVEKTRVTVILVQSIADGHMAQMVLSAGNEVWRRALAAES